jgi:uncharacterized membrane protein YoaK (UPF0700 family)
MAPSLNFRRRVTHRRADETHEVRLAVLLAWAAGYVDAVGYLAFSGLFVANMTGNTVVAVTDLTRQDWEMAWHRAFPIPVFILGAAFGSLVIEATHRRRWRSAHAAAFGLESALLAVFAIAAHPLEADGAIRASNQVFYALVTLPTLAMGIQSAAFRRVGSRKVRTTYVSGVLTSLAEEAVAWCFRLTGREPETTPPADGPASSIRVRLLAGVWTAYAVGAVLGAFLQSWFALVSLVLPIGLLLLAAGWDLMSPNTPVATR